MVDEGGRTGARPDLNPVLAAIVGVIEGKQDPKTLDAIVNQAREELAALRPDIQRTISGLDSNVRESCAVQIGQLSQAFGLYEAGLDSIKRYLSDGQMNALTWGGEQVRRAEIQLNESLSRLRGAALLAMGPTDMPDYNLIHQLYERHKQGEPREGNFAAAIERMGQRAADALAQAQAQPVSDERDILAGAYQVHIEAIDTLRAYVREGREELLEKGMQETRSAMTAIRDLLPAIQMKMRCSGPTHAPMVNFVVNMASEVAAGTVGFAALQSALDQLKSHFEDSKTRFERIVRGPIESVLMREETGKIQEILTQQAAAIDLLYRFLRTQDVQLLGDGCQRLVEAQQRMEEAQKTFNDIAAREGKTLCIRCSHYNERDRRTCEKCGAVLLQASETAPTSTLNLSDDGSPRTAEEAVPVGENVQRIFSAVNQVVEGTIDLEQFSREVDWLEGVVEHYASKMGPRPPKVDPKTLPENEREAYRVLSPIADEVEAAFHDAVAFFREGLARYRQYAQDKDKDNLMEGTRSIWEGNKKLNLIQALNAEVQQKVRGEAAEPTVIEETAEPTQSDEMVG